MRVHRHRLVGMFVHVSQFALMLYIIEKAPSATTAVCGTVFILQLQLAPSATFHLHHFQSYSYVGVGAQGCLISVSLTKHSGMLLLHYLIYSNGGRLFSSDSGWQHIAGSLQRAVLFLTSEIHSFATKDVKSLTQIDRLIYWTQFAVCTVCSCSTTISIIVLLD